MFSFSKGNKPHLLVSILLLTVLNFWSFELMAENKITVKPGQTITKIMRQQYPGQRSRWPILMREIVKSNPSAFVNGDPRSLKEGSIIKLPQQSAIKKVVKKRTRAATVSGFSGTVTLFDNMKKIKHLKVGSHVYVGDQLLTSDAGMLSLKFIDGATVKLRCNSLLNIDQYAMRSRGSISELTLLKGSLRAKSGRIGRRGNDRYVLKTPVGKVTASKAEYGVRVLQSQACGRQADVATDGLYLAVLNGRVNLLNANAKLLVDSGDAAKIEKSDSKPVSVEGFSGMVFGDKKITETPVKELQAKYEVAEVKSDESVKEENDVPIWWMLASLVILGITF